MADLAARLIGSWDLQSRIDRNAAGEQRHEPGLGSDPFGFLVFDRTGHFAAQFMKRDRKSAVDAPATAAAVNNSFARGIRARYGKEPKISYYETVALADKASGRAAAWNDRRRGPAMRNAI